MKLVVMTKSTFFVEEDKILASLFDEGLENLHLLKPASSPLYAERLLTLLPESVHHFITVHEHFYLKNEFDLAGIHLDLPTLDAPSGYRGRVTRSCNQLDLLKAAKKNSKYVFLHNIFNSIEYPEEKSSFTLPLLESAAKKGMIDKHVYAMGGMTIDNIKIAKDLGFGGVVICGDLWNHFDIHQQFDYKELIVHFGRLRKAIE
ncbi:MAG: thiamine phosphate synthase [Prevotella sp.]|nr:thiamine phosphate synthase [Prevotella sp.]